MKICFKCLTAKPLSDFYKQRGMLDGHLNKCKECTKNDVRKHRAANIDAIREYDRKRGMRQDRREASKIRARLKPAYETKAAWAKRNKHKRNAHITLRRAIISGTIARKTTCEKCAGHYLVEAHHEDYSKPLEVQWLCKWCHMARHRELNEMRRQAARMCEAAE